MSNANLCFEYSEVDADIKGHVNSIRNFLSGKVVVNSLGEYIEEEPVRECKGVIEIRPKEDGQEKKWIYDIIVKYMLKYIIIYSI